MPYEYEVIDPIITKHIVDALTSAFGGASQVADSTIGAAIFGNANNHDWGRDRIENVIKCAARLVAERWEDTGAEVDAVRLAIVDGYHAARAKMPGTSAPDLA
jgi:hypothetical protein